MISDAELEVMTIVWKDSPITAKQIIEQLPKSLGWSDKTVKTLLNRLVKKNALSYTSVGREYLYSPIIQKQNVQAEVSNQILNRLFNGKLSSMVSYFAQNEKLTKSEIEELESIIKEIKPSRV